MLTSRIGIMVVIDDSADKQMFPLVRVQECLREKAESWLDKSRVQEILNLIEPKATPDPKRINKAGLIDVDFALCLVLDEIDKFVLESSEICDIIFDALSLGHLGLPESVANTCLRLLSPKPSSAP